MNYAIKYYGKNDFGYPEKWPSRVQPTDSKSLPTGFDVLRTEEEYKAHVDSLKGAADAVSAAIKSAPALAEKADADAKEALLKQLESASDTWSSMSSTDKFNVIKLMVQLFPFVARKLLAK